MSNFNRPTIQEIYARIKADMESRVSSGVKIPRFSLLGILAIVFAGAMHLLYGYLVWLADQLFIDTASTWFLDRIANLYNLPRKPATYTTGVTTLTGTAGFLVAAGEVLVNSDGLEYTTDVDVTLTGGTGDVACTADVLSPGTVGNTEDLTLTVQNPTADLSSVATVVSGFDDGVDVETNDQLRERLRQRIQNPPSSGTTADYVRWLLSVPGVNKAWCFDAESTNPAVVGMITVGAGSVVLVIAAADLSVVSATIKANAEAYIDSVKPATARYDMYDADPKQTIMSISLAPNTVANQQAVSTNLTALFIAETIPSGTILLSAMRSAVAAAAVTDYRIDVINYDGAPVALDDLETPGLEVAQFTSGIYSGI